MCTVFSLGASKNDQKTIISAKWLNFANLETLGVNTLYPRELMMKFKVVYNVVSDNFYFDQNTVRCLWKITVSDLKNPQICEFGQLWKLLEGELCKIGSLSWIYKLFKI